MESRSVPVLVASALRKSYGASVAVDGVTFSVGRREIVGLLGPNGAGKTTTIEMVLGVLAPDEGSVRIAGEDVRSRRSSALQAANFAAAYAPLPGNLTVEQNLRVFGLLYGIEPLAERVDSVVGRFGLGPKRGVKCGLLSSGEQARVSLAKAMLNEPSLLLLDEPTSSLDPAAAREIRTAIRDFVLRDGGCALWASHNMVEVEEVCDRVLFLSRGKILLEGDPRRLPGEHGMSTLEELFVAVAREPLSLEGGWRP